jgi:hypothetical protein
MAARTIFSKVRAWSQENTFRTMLVYAPAENTEVAGAFGALKKTGHDVEVKNGVNSQVRELRCVRSYKLEISYKRGSATEAWSCW